MTRAGPRRARPAATPSAASPSPMPPSSSECRREWSRQSVGLTLMRPVPSCLWILRSASTSPSAARSRPKRADSPGSSTSIASPKTSLRGSRRANPPMSFEGRAVDQERTVHCHRPCARRKAAPDIGAHRRARDRDPVEVRDARIGDAAGRIDADHLGQHRQRFLECRCRPGRSRLRKVPAAGLPTCSVGRNRGLSPGCGLHLRHEQLQRIEEGLGIEQPVHPCTRPSGKAAATPQPRARDFASSREVRRSHGLCMTGHSWRTWFSRSYGHHDAPNVPGGHE